VAAKNQKAKIKMQDDKAKFKKAKNRIRNPAERPDSRHSLPRTAIRGGNDPAEQVDRRNDITHLFSPFLRKRESIPRRRVKFRILDTVIILHFDM